MRTAVFIGRFQPLHKGHWQAMRSIARSFDKLIVIIGSPTTISAASSHNPLTTRERKEMLRTMLCELKISCEINTQRDVGVNTIWLAEVQKKIPKDSVIVSGNPNVLSLFRNHYQTRKVRKQVKVSGTLIRRLVRSDSDRWKALVPGKIAVNDLARRLSRGAR